MAIDTVKLENAKKMYAEYITAERAVLQGQSYSIGDRTLTRADLTKIQDGRAFWAAEILSIEQGSRGIRIRRVIPRDS